MLIGGGCGHFTGAGICSGTPWGNKRRAAPWVLLPAGMWDGADGVLSQTWH